MNLEEAKKILKKEFSKIDIYKAAMSIDLDVTRWSKYEKPEVLDALRALAKDGYYVYIPSVDYLERDARLKKEYEENTKAPVYSYPTSKVQHNGDGEPTPGGPALHEAASEFNDALLDEQAKKIEELKRVIESRNNKIGELQESIKKRKAYIASVNKVLCKKNKTIKELREESSKHLRDKIKVFYENQELEKKADQYAGKLADACVDLRELKEKLANITVNNVNAQALKSAEHALVEKDAIIQEKDEVIKDLGEELAEEKKKREPIELSSQGYLWGFINSVYGKHLFDEEEDNMIFDAVTAALHKVGVSRTDKNAISDDEWKKLQDEMRKMPKSPIEVMVRNDEKDEGLKAEAESIDELHKKLEKVEKDLEWARNASKEYCDYGVEANNLIKKLANLYVLAHDYGTFNGEMLERCKNYRTYGFHVPLNNETKKAIDEIASGKEKASSTSFETLRKTALDCFGERNKKLEDFMMNAGYKGGNGILDLLNISDKELEEKFKDFLVYGECFFKESVAEDTLIEKCKKHHIEVHYHADKEPTYTNAFGYEVPISILRAPFAMCTDEEFDEILKR